MKIYKPEIKSIDQQNVKVYFSYLIGDTKEQFYYNIPFPIGTIKEQSLSDAALVLGLMMGMSVGEDIEVVDQKVSPKLIENVGIIQDIWTQWVPSKFSKVKLTATPSVEVVERTGGIGSTFTGGVDSFYTQKKHSDELNHLFYVIGYDVLIHQREFANKVKLSTDNAVNELSQSMNYFETDLRTVSDKYVQWLYYHGAAIAAVGQLASPVIDKLYVPSTRSYADLRPMGSHPLTDPLWGTEYLEIIHDGADVGRTEKLASISTYAPAQKSLRVCWRSNDKINCGECEKCLRTMAVLDILGKLQNVETFPNEVTERLPNIPITPHYLWYVEDMLAWFDRHPDRVVNTRPLGVLRENITKMTQSQLEESLKDLDAVQARGVIHYIGKDRTKLLLKEAVKLVIEKLGRKIRRW